MKYDNFRLSTYARDGERTLWTPTASCLYVADREMGGIIAPVSLFAEDPTRMARVEKPWVIPWPEDERGCDKGSGVAGGAGESE